MKRVFFLCFVLVAVCGCCGCGENKTGTKPQGNVLVDDQWNKVVFSSVPQRIVSLVPGNTEIVAALGEIDKIAGVTVFDDLPAIKKRIDEKKIGVVGGGMDPSIEKIMALNPDLVLVNGKSQNRIAEKLHDVHVKTFSLDPHSVRELLQDFAKAGKILNREKEAEMFQKKFQEVVSGFPRRKNKKKARVYFEMWDRPLMSIGGKALENELVELCGGENIFKDVPQNVFKVNAEAVIGRNPDVMIMAREEAIPYAGVEKREAWKSIQAVKNAKVFEIDSGLLRRGPKILQAFVNICTMIQK